MAQNKIATLDNIFGIVTKKHTNNDNNNIMLQMNNTEETTDKGIYSSQLDFMVNSETNQVNENNMTNNDVNYTNDIDYTNNINNPNNTNNPNKVNIHRINSDENIFSVNNKKSIIHKIHYFNKEEHLEILKIVKNNNDKFSENDNGVFINLSKLKKSTFIEINKFVDFCMNNKRNLEIDNLNRDNMKKYLSDDNTQTRLLELPNSELLN